MATFHGKGGKVYWDTAGTNITEVTEWTLEASADVSEQTSMQDTWKTYLVGFKDWTATVTARAPAAGPEIPFPSANSGMGADVSGNLSKLDLYMVWDSDTPAYDGVYGDAVCSGISYSVDANDVGMVTYTFQGHGVLTSYSNDTVSHTYA